MHITTVPAQLPPRQASPLVQRFMSLQGLPSALGGLVQRPVARSQVPALWHWSSAVQASSVPLQFIPRQASFRVQGLPSLQRAPLRAPQLPSLPAPAAREQAWQSFWLLPPQALLQQTPSTQNPDMQSPLPVHGRPLPSRPQRPLKHLVPVTHWASDTQVVSQAVPEALHTMMGAQETMGAARHMPIPSQREAARAIPPLQLLLAHTVPGAYRRHCPRPSQTPSRPQLGARWSWHWPVGSAAPAGTGVQTPADWGKAQDTQEPVQAPAQQTPWAQMPEAHSVGLLAVQGSPLGLRPQLPRTQTLGVAHSVSVAQRWPHWFPLQRLGVQLRVVVAQAPFRQVPMAYRLAEASQLSAWQMVPLA